MSMDRSTRQKINQETALNDTLDQIDLLDIYRTSIQKAAEDTFFSSAQGTFLRIDTMLGHKQVLRNLRVLKLHQAFFKITMV